MYYVISGIIFKSEVLFSVVVSIVGVGILVYVDVFGVDLSLILVVFCGNCVEVILLLVFVIVWNKCGDECVLFLLNNKLFLCDLIILFCDYIILLWVSVMYDFWLLLNSNIVVLRNMVSVDINMLLWYGIVFLLFNVVFFNFVELKLFVNE